MTYDNQETISSINADIEKEQKTNEELKAPVKAFQVNGIALLLMNVKALVDNEDAVRVTVTQGQQTTVFEIKVAQSDLGKVIGKRGETARSLRKILYGFSVKHNMRSVMEIVE